MATTLPTCYWSILLHARPASLLAVPRSSDLNGRFSAPLWCFGCFEPSWSGSCTCTLKRLKRSDRGALTQRATFCLSAYQPTCLPACCSPWPGAHRTSAHSLGLVCKALLAQISPQPAVTRPGTASFPETPYPPSQERERARSWAAAATAASSHPPPCSKEEGSRAGQKLNPHGSYTGAMSYEQSQPVPICESVTPSTVAPASFSAVPASLTRLIGRHPSALVHRSWRHCYLRGRHAPANYGWPRFLTFVVFGSRAQVTLRICTHTTPPAWRASSFIALS